MSKLIEPQESFPKEDWIQYARLLKLEKNTLHESCLAVDKLLERFQTLQNRIFKWGRETFGSEQRKAGVYAHLRREIDELAPGMREFENIDPEELADCTILLFELAGFAEVGLLEEVEKKFLINQGRTWGPIEEDGSILHVKK